MFLEKRGDTREREVSTEEHFLKNIHNFDHFLVSSLELSIKKNDIFF